MKPIRAIPTTYNGVLFRSTLEADWAANLDTYVSTRWSYEPIALNLDGVRYLPDFYIEHRRFWLEVKGPHLERQHKPRRLAEFVTNIDDWRTPLVIIGRIPVAGALTWTGVTGREDIRLAECPRCEYRSFIDWNGPWCCHVCGAYLTDGASAHGSRELPYVRARAPREAA